MNKCYIVDIDGTLADITHRLHFIEGDTKDWDSFFAACKDDKPIMNMKTIVFCLSAFDDVIFVSGRPEKSRQDTEAWLNDLGFEEYQLYMRKDGDHREDYKVKEEILAEIQKDYEVIAAIDDRKQVVDMWRRHGILTLQCAEGDY